MSSRLPFLALLGAVLLGGCAVGPDYHRPDAPTPTAFKEATGLPGGIVWQSSQPKDGAPGSKGKWWEIYHDPELNALEEQVAISNQNVLVFEAQYREAKATVGVARAAGLPNVSVSPSVTQIHSGGGNATGANGNGGGSGGDANNYASSATQTSIPVDASWTLDIWGAVRRNVEENASNAQAAYANLINAQLSYQSTLAQDYFNLHGLDAQQASLQASVASYQKFLQLTQNQYQAGIVSRADVASAQAQLTGAQAELIDVGIERAQFEHAVAVLTGKPPADLTLKDVPLTATPPAIPLSVPTTLLERRPDIAAAERQTASANAAIGVAVAAFYPQLTLSGTVGYESFQLSQLFSGPSFFWSVGPTLAQTLFDGGLRHSEAQEARAAYDAAVATYRQTVLTAFQQVEDHLVALGRLEAEQKFQEETVDAAQIALNVTLNGYKAGTDTYLQVITAQNVLFTAQINVIKIRTSRMIDSALLIEALGGGWDENQMAPLHGAAPLQAPPQATADAGH